MLEKQVRRMLADARSRILATNFAAQWLHLRNLDSITPDLRLFPDFDDNLRQAFRQETELFFESVLREDRSVLDLLKADYTFLNERLAKHYGIPHVYGSRFRRVALGADGERGGLLRHGSILTVTSYATRTSPVIRGKWVLENLLGTPPPPPPAERAGARGQHGVGEPARPRAAGRASRQRRLRELPPADGPGRLRAGELRRRGPLADAGGGQAGRRDRRTARRQRVRRRRRPGAGPAQAAGAVRPHADREAADVRPGPGVEDYDAPAIRKIVRDARANDYRFSSLIVGITTSTPFQMRRSRMIVTKKALSRRTFLRGVGAALALPLLDAMIPADDRPGRDAGRPGTPAPPRLRLHADGLRRHALDAARRATGSTSCRPSSRRWRR